MVSYNSPAKINLFLKVLGKGPSGYHKLSTLLQTVDLCDQLDIEVFKDGSLTNQKDELVCDVSKVPTDASNLVLKAASLFREKSGFDFTIKVILKKKIPIEAGLGGGSGNAATTLWALNEFFNKKFSIQTLMDWGACIGSDVPFFLSQGTAYCTGRGELVENMPPLDKTSLWIVKPHCSLSARIVYENLNLETLVKRDPLDPLDPLDFLAKIRRGEFPCFNDLEDSACKLAPELVCVKEKLEKQNLDNVVLSGSGSAFFCMGDVKHYTEHKEEGVESFRVNYLNRKEGEWY